MTIAPFTISIDSQSIHVSFTPYCFSEYGHFIFRSPYDPPRRIPFSETGFKSYFAPMWQIEEYGTPQQCAEEIARLLWEAEKKKPADEKENDQLALF